NGGNNESSDEGSDNGSDDVDAVEAVPLRRSTPRITGRAPADYANWANVVVDDSDTEI
nr:hypothetical protein [Tanacetum cinerariifolium]